MPAIVGIIYNAFITHCHLDPSPLILSQQIKAPTLQALHAYESSELITRLSVCRVGA